ncbi:DUF4286 family protein [Chloroflexota bacterium]
MKSNTVAILVGRKCHPDQETELIKWYKEHHVPDLMKFKGLKRCTLLKLLKPEEKYPDYVLTLEFNNQKDYEDYEVFLVEGRKKGDRVRLNIQAEQVWRVPYKTVDTWEQ